MIFAAASSPTAEVFAQVMTCATACARTGAVSGPKFDPACVNACTEKFAGLTCPPGFMFDPEDWRCQKGQRFVDATAVSPGIVDVDPTKFPAWALPVGLGVLALLVLRK